VSYNIDSIEIVASDGFLIGKGALRALRKELDDDLPEINLFDQAEEDDSPGEFWHPERGIWWSGEGSGHAEAVLIESVLPKFTGSADLVLTWEGGDSHTGLRLKDGKVTRHSVVMALGEEE
jgi:hypothetical protein